MNEQLKQPAIALLHALRIYDQFPEARRKLGSDAFEISGGHAYVLVEYSPNSTWTTVRLFATETGDPKKQVASGTIMAAGNNVAVLAFDCGDEAAEQMILVAIRVTADAMIRAAKYLRFSCALVAPDVPV